ncbi:sensor histidine kinase [Paenibacillus allorhizosphaerae]|uniref:HAMP domain-containing protein n=1 Tax=Paenibacillus allorhizosphaerae TaxID=2849866 RepID=A0ABM8VBC2_9BACL|nr:sensor histidine kinase [Paenibacillus allorhizosphaerae]CAG7619088.1 hypothetical protein PAECIP111802_00585 [Paenibacillus allorhizosphaerae]
MKRWRNWHYRCSIKTKILTLVLSVSFLSIVMMAAFTSHYYTEAAKADFYVMAQDSTARINHQLDRYFKQLAQSTYASIAGPLPSQWLDHNPESGMLQSWLQDGGRFNREQEALVEGIMTRYIAINYSNIIGIVLRSTDNRLAYSKDNSLNVSMTGSAPWFKSGLFENLTVVPFYYNPNSVYAAYPLITLIVPVYDPDSLKLTGNLNIAMSITEVQSILGQARLGQTGYFFIVDSKGEIVYHPDVELAGRALQDTYLSGLKLSEKNDTYEKNGETILVSHNRSELTGWNIVAYVPMSEMATGLNIARNSTLVILSGIVLLSLLFIPRLVDWVVRPIIRLRNLMKRVERGDLSASAEVLPGKDEIQQLNGSFNQMTARLRELIHTVHDLQMKEMQQQLRQRDALIQALQNQINPHLLYNTLEIIKSIAFIEKVPTIEKMATNLASVYRYTSKMPRSEVLLRDELRVLQKYLEIIRIRFGHKFKSEIIVDEQYMELHIIKLSLQPIVENCVKYAVEPKNGNATIRITAYEEEDVLVLEVADNGNGFSREALQSLQENMRYAEEPFGPVPEEQSVGIANVHARMILNYGTSYGVRVHSVEGMGSILSLRFPKRVRASS